MSQSTAPTVHIPLLSVLDDMPISKCATLLDEKGVHIPVDIVNWPDQFPYKPLVQVNSAHTSTHIFLDFFVRGNCLKAVGCTNNADVYKDSCVEFFVQPLPDGPYYNFEFNCIGTIHAARRTDRHNGTLLSDAELDSVARFASCGTRAFNEMEGIFAWNLTVDIPLEVMGLKYDGNPLAMRGNFYKCADETSCPHFLSWAPVDTPKPDFHRPEFFGTIILD